MKNKKTKKGKASSKSKLGIKEVKRIILISSVCALLLACTCAYLIVTAPDRNYKNALSLADKRDFTGALTEIQKLENALYDEEKITNARVEIAEEMISAGEYDGADSLISELSGETRTELEKKSSYARADYYMQNGSYTEALRVFYKIYDYKDAEEKYLVCRCALAAKAYLEDDEDRVRQLMLNMPDAEKHLKAAVSLAYGTTEQAEEILQSKLFSSESLERMVKGKRLLNDARELLPQGKIACGTKHTAAVLEDGTVAATGDNSYGQCNVSGGENVVMIACGAYHTVGLKSDGTVIATGDNSEGQCDVKGWTDIVSIAAAAYDTIGLKSDGTVVATGMHADKAAGWHGAIKVTGGSYSFGCLLEDGTMLCTHKGAEIDSSGLADLSVCGQTSVAVTDSGEVISGYNVPQWEEVLSVYCGTNGIFAINSDGEVLSCFFRQSEAIEITLPEKAVEISASGTHIAVLGENGRLYAFGNNDSGQLNTEDWSVSVK